LSGKPPPSSRQIAGKQLARIPDTISLMLKRIVGAVLIMLATYLAYMGIWIALVMAGFSVEGESAVEGESGWLGPEPEMLIPIAALFVAALLCWLGARLWGRREHQR
jgi:hypothetical protein